MPFCSSSRRTASAPVSIAAPLPRLRACRITAAPASLARLAVPSREPSSTTTTSPAPGIALAAPTVACIRSASFHAGMTTASSCASGMSRSYWFCRLVLRYCGLDALQIGVIDEREHRIQAGDLKDLPYRGLGRGDLKLAAPLARAAQAGEQHVHAGRVAELDA